MKRGANAKCYYVGANAYPLEQLETDMDELILINRWLINAKQHVWQCWKGEYIRALMETYRIESKGGGVPDVGDILLIVGDEKNRGEWKKGIVLCLRTMLHGVSFCVKMVEESRAVVTVSLSVGT